MGAGEADVGAESVPGEWGAGQEAEDRARGRRDHHAVHPHRPDVTRHSHWRCAGRMTGRTMSRPSAPHTLPAPPLTTSSMDLHRHCHHPGRHLYPNSNTYTCQSPVTTAWSPSGSPGPSSWPLMPRWSRGAGSWHGHGRESGHPSGRAADHPRPVPPFPATQPPRVMVTIRAPCSEVGSEAALSWRDTAGCSSGRWLSSPARATQAPTAVPALSSFGP